MKQNGFGLVLSYPNEPTEAQRVALAAALGTRGLVATHDGGWHRRLRYFVTAEAPRQHVTDDDLLGLERWLETQRDLNYECEPIVDARTRRLDV